MFKKCFNVKRSTPKKLNVVVSKHNDHILKIYKIRKERGVIHYTLATSTHFTNLFIDTSLELQFRIIADQLTAGNGLHRVSFKLSLILFNK